MKTSGGHIITIRALLTLLLGMISCTSSRDIYHNPYQSTNFSPANTNQTIHTNQDPPEWIYAVSRDFFVGYGQGNNIREARDAALNDIKTFIVKSLGETGDFIEVNFVQNTVSGRNIVECQEGYLMKQQFENKYNPVVNISIDRIDDYYYEKIDDTVKFYIKYNIDNETLNQIKDNFKQSLQEETARAILHRQFIDSLTNLGDLQSIESIIERFDAISNYLLTSVLQRNDSLNLIQTLHKIRGYLNTIQIKVFEHNPGINVRFSLCSGQTPISSDFKPFIISNAVSVDTMIKQNEVWDLKYSIDPNLSGNDIFEIVYELPYDRISTSLEIPPALIKPKFKVIEQVIFYDLHKDGWTGKLRNLTFRININSNSTETFWLKSLDIILHVNENFTPLIMAENLNFNVNPGINSLIKTVECDLPARFFMTRDIDCDLRFYYSASNTMDVCQINNIPITVNDF